MVEISTFNNSPFLSAARRVTKYVLIYCSKGNLLVQVDDKVLPMIAGDVLTITSGQVHFIKEAAHANGYILQFTLDFFCKDDNDIELIFQNSLFCHFAMNEVIPSADETIVHELERIGHELEEKPYQYLVSVHSRIKLILIAINRVKVKRGDEIWKPDALFLKFLEAVRNNFEQNYPLSSFAKMLGTTELKLNELAKIHTGKTAQNVIYGLIASEAKRLLTYENLTVKEVAYKLGFNDPFYFSNFFKKHTAVSPKSYQESKAI